MFAETPAQKLCTSCGLCCDGSLFVYMHISQPELYLIGLTAGDVQKQPDGSLAYPFPCIHLHEKHCAIYTSQRPRVCGAFQCELLKKYLRGEVSNTACLGLIKKTIWQRDQVREKLEKAVGQNDLNLPALFDAWAALQPPEVLQAIPPTGLYQEYIALQMIFIRHFKPLPGPHPDASHRMTG